MPSNKLQVRLEGGVARLLLDKPGKLNALDEEMLTEIDQHFVEWERDGSVSVVLLGSTSDRAFCVGADLEVLSRLDAQRMHDWEILGSRMLDRIQNSPLISVAAIRGHALGGGLTLAAVCDLRIAAEQATFAQPEIGLGWIPGWCGVARLARLVGAGRAKELCFTARRIDAFAARTLGLVDDVVSKDEFEGRIGQIAQQLASSSPTALRAIKRLADAQQPPLAPNAAEFDALLNATLLSDPRGQAALVDFLARRSKKNA